MITTFCPICHRPYDVSLGECPVCSRQAEAEQQNRKGRKRFSLDGILNARRLGCIRLCHCFSQSEMHLAV